MLEVCESQVGYHEKASNKDLDSKTGNAGSKNYTKYAKFFDDLRKQGIYVFNYEKNPECTMFRSLYGNTYEIPYTKHDDVKIYTTDKLPESDDYLSCTEKTFGEGLVGEYIRNKFTHPCKYEFIKQAYAHELYTEEGDERYVTESLIERSMRDG